MAQQTAVDWLRDELFKAGSGTPAAYSLLFEQAKQMEKEQIIIAHYISGCVRNNDDDKWQRAEQYYNETYIR